MSKNILIVVESYVRWLFFSRMRRSIENMGYNVLYFTTCLSVMRQETAVTASIQLVHNSARACDDIIPEKTYLETLDVKSGELSPQAAERFARMVFGNLREITDRFKPETVFIYNGTTIFGAVVGAFARQNGIKTCYFELANLPGKMFVDPEGTGARSRLYCKPELLELYPCNMEAFDEWRADFIRHKLENGFVPQVTHGKNSFKDYGFYALDKLYFSHLIGERVGYLRCYIQKFINAFLAKPQIKYDEEIELLGADYLFYPMQVSHDSQILLHSQIDNVQAIVKAHELAKDSGVELIVKPHPAEADKLQLAKIYELKQKLGFKLSRANTMYLIQNAKAVVTINSTVGLEAKIAGKNVCALGKAYYSTFDDFRLARYVQNYLVPIDYFSDQPIEESAITKILSRVEAC